MPANYSDWTPSTPNTHPAAVASLTRAVVNVRAIRVSGATYRDSQPMDGVFELVGEVPQEVNSEERYEVYCAWFGVKPPTCYPRILVRSGAYEILNDFTGEVIDNISASPSLDE